ncbi:MAG: hypothetical protein P0Y59_14470 [Candidatus Sphingomonas phytovorans]|nr:hypothetical protein [Sphingomonas sp.]WEJ98148.1 MAG: hypothetical protein P0Y59_14470 [Sphingomonas sp.]
MARPVDPRQVAKLVAVQHVRRAAADSALAAARAAEAEALSAQQSAREAADSARDDWFAHLAEPGFAPDYARGLAGRLMQREGLAEEADTRHRLSADLHARRQDDWRSAEARVQLTEAQHEAARRDAARRREEKRLDALSDRVTYNWMMR